MACVVYGSSFVARLMKYERKWYGRECLDVKGQGVGLRGMPGATIGTLRERMSRDRDLNGCALVVLQIGSNDLCHADRSAEDVASDLIDLATFLITTHHVGRVVICQLLYRQSAAHMDKGLSVGSYNARIDMVNEHVTAQCAQTALPISFWRHGKGVLRANALHADGIHINEEKMERYRHSIIGALSCHHSQ